MSFTEKIVQIAKSYIGQEEIQPNKGFKDPDFEKKMRARGWEPGQSWCAYFAKQCWVEAYADNAGMLAHVKQYSNGGALNTLENWKSKVSGQVSMVPVLGAEVIFIEGHGPMGHAGIVTGVNGNTFLTIEGNTNTNGSREGYEVAAKSHQLGQPFKPNGLNIAGFIHPLELTN